MFTPGKKDIKHKIQLLRLLRAILANNYLATNLMFKGGTYASLRGSLDRFSVDLDFDLPDKNGKLKIREILYEIFSDLDLEIKDESENYLQFYLKYNVPPNERNTLKLEISDVPSRFNKYENVSLLEVNMYCKGHTLDTMFANKLVAATARFDKTGKIAGRDFYDIHRFFKQGLEVNKDVVKDLTNMEYSNYLALLIQFINDKVTDRLLNEDLNPLVEIERFNKELPYLREELLFMLRGEMEGQIKRRL